MISEFMNSVYCPPLPSEYSTGNWVHFGL